MGRHGRAVRLGGRSSGAARRALLSGGPRSRHRDPPRPLARQAVAARRRGRGRQDRGGEGPGRAARTPADPSSVLRGDRRLPGALRVELRATAAGRPRARCVGGGAARRRSLRSRVPRGATAARRDPGGLERRLARGRARSRGRRVRGVPARDPLGVRRDHPGGGSGGGGVAAGGRGHVEPDEGAPRRAEAALPVSLDRPPRAGSRGGDRARSRATSRRRSPGSGGSTWRSSPAWPRRSTGPTPSRSWARIV